VSGIRIVRGIPDDQCALATILFWEAFADKLGRILSPEPRALRFLETALRPDFALAALDGAGRVRGVAGLKTGAGGLVAAGFRDLARAYGTAGALWRAPLLELTARPAEPGALTLDGLFVAAEARGRGIGTRLVFAVVGEAERLGLDAVRLDVTVQNARARALYERMGFEPVAARRAGLAGHALGLRAVTTMRRPVGAAGPPRTD